MSTVSDYQAKMLPYANKAATALGMDAKVILAQWQLESGSGTSNHAKNFNNHAGIKYSQYSKTAYKRSDSAFAGYRTLDDFVTDYIRVLKLGYYDNVRSADTVEGTVKALGASPYDAGHYELNGVQGGKLLNLLGLKVGGSTIEKKPTAAKECPTCHRPL